MLRRRWDLPWRRTGSTAGVGDEDCVRDVPPTVVAWGVPAAAPALASAGAASARGGDAGGLRVKESPGISFGGADEATAAGRAVSAQDAAAVTGTPSATA